MENFNKPEEQTTSDNFGLSADNSGNTKDCSQSVWGDISVEAQNYLSKKGMKTPADLLCSYRELEKAYSSKISLPKDGDQEGFRKLYSHLGMPENSSLFEIKFDKDDEAFRNDFQEVCFQNNILPKSAQGIYDWFVKNRNEQSEKFEQERIAQSFRDAEEQKKDWGLDCSRRLEQMKRGIRLFLGDDDMAVDAMEQALGTKKMMQLFSGLGEAISEDNPVGFGKSGKSDRQFDMVEYFREMFNDY